MRYAIFFAFVCLSCKNEIHSDFMKEYFQKNNYLPGVIKKDKIKSRTEKEITTQFRQPVTFFSDGKMISLDKIRSIDYFDNNGLCTLSVNPTYKMKESDTFGFYKLSALDKWLF